MSNTPPIGQRFSHVYLKRGVPASDSERMRRRISSFFYEFGFHDCNAGRNIELELGVDVPRFDYRYDYKSFFLRCELRDFLDAITIIWRSIRGSHGLPKDAGAWVKVVGRVFQEENVGYRVDDQGGVHFAVDAEFEHNVASSLAALGSSRYNGVLAAFQVAQEAFDQTPPNGKDAMRSAFEAVEILFRLIFPKAPRLASDQIKAHLEPHVQAHLSEDKTAARATMKVLASFSDWVDGVHFYRHGQGEVEPTQPPLSLAVLTVSTAASYLRWLAEFDEMAQPLEGGQVYRQKVR